jgi:hypothetical protein
VAVARIVMKTINLPEGNAFGVDDDDGGIPYVNYAEQRAKTLFFVWVSLTEHKWVILGERRGTVGGCRASIRRCTSPSPGGQLRPARAHAPS